MTDRPVTVTDIAELLHRIRLPVEDPTAGRAERAEVLTARPTCSPASPSSGPTNGPANTPTKCPVTRKAARCQLIRPVHPLLPLESWPVRNPRGGWVGW
jgi:hypothetical protein